MTWTLHRLALLVALAGVLSAATAETASAKSCGVQVIDDWYGGHLTKTYPLRCYRDALTIVNQRADISIYTNARQDILLALQAAIARGRRGGGGKGPGAPAAAAVLNDPATADALPSFLGGPDAKGGGQAPDAIRPVTTNRAPRTTTSSPIDTVINAGNSSASSVPLPAIVLGAIAGLLLALGCAAYLARRRQIRRQTLRPQPESGARNP